MSASWALAILAAAASSAPPPPAGLRVGAAMEDITPPPAGLANGFRIRDHLFARVLFVEEGGDCAVLVGLDQGNAVPAVVEEAIARGSRRLGCAPGNFVVSATHTHSSNSRGLNAPTVPDSHGIVDAVVRAMERAKAAARPARIGYGTTPVDLNVNRDLYAGGRWYQAANPAGRSDKTLAALWFVDAAGVPIGVYMNYAMHPIDFYLSGLISADFPGEASRYVERRQPGAVAIFTQGASGDQNPRMTMPMLRLSGIRTRMPGATDASIDAKDQWLVSAEEVNANARQTEEMKHPVTATERPAYDDAVARTGEFVSAMGAIIGESTLQMMHDDAALTSDAAGIWSEERKVVCPGRDRTDQTARQGTMPTYVDGPPVELEVGLLRIGDAYVARLNGEAYSAIGMRLKREAPSARLMLVTLANGRANSGYVYSNEAGDRLTFEVIGSRLKPGCAEDGIVSAELAMFADAARSR